MWCRTPAQAREQRTVLQGPAASGTRVAAAGSGRGHPQPAQPPLLPVPCALCPVPVPGQGWLSCAGTGCWQLLGSVCLSSSPRGLALWSAEHVPTSRCSPWRLLWQAGQDSAEPRRRGGRPSASVSLGLPGHSAADGASRRWKVGCLAVRGAGRRGHAAADLPPVGALRVGCGLSPAASGFLRVPWPAEASP